MPEQHTAYLGLGSNLAQPKEQISKAIETLNTHDKIVLLARSKLYRSRPVGPAGQPDYFNAAVAIRSALSPEQLLDEVQLIEQAQQRQRAERWGPRTLDIDILLFADHSLKSPRLTIPHPELAKRNFVVQPLLDINPQLQLPDGRLLADILHIIGTEGLEHISDT